MVEAGQKYSSNTHISNPKTIVSMS
uniref:Uncharacterized protein n=1 Tax=Arundo donax TaxID=35708 RepID=A0A0A8YV29_ARUDO